MFSIVGNFHVWDDWYIGDDKLTKFHVCSYFPNKHLGFNLRSSNKQNPKILRKAKTRKFWTNRLNFVPIRPQKYLFNFTFSSCFLIIWNVFIFSQKNLKRACLVCYSIHTVDFKIHSSVECSSSYHILKFKLTCRISILLFTHALIDLGNRKPLTPNFANESIKFLLWGIFRERIICFLNILIKVQFPMLILIFNSPLHNAHIADRSANDCSIFKNFYRLNHACVSTEASSCCHFFFFHKIKSEVSNFKFFNCQSGKPKDIQTSSVATTNSVV